MTCYGLWVMGLRSGNTWINDPDEEGVGAATAKGRATGKTQYVLCGGQGLGVIEACEKPFKYQLKKKATLFLTENISRVQKTYNSYKRHLQYSTKWKHAMIFLQIFWTDCVIVADWVNKTDRIPSLEILKRKVLSNVVSLSFEMVK